MTSPSVLITGALTGIGRATAYAFAEAGARLMISGRREKAGRALLWELREKGVEAEFVRADVRDDDEVRKLVDAAVARFGRLDAAVNNAGTEGTVGPIVEQSAESYAATFDTNVLGTLLCMKHEVRIMLPQGSGSIVNLSSAMGKKGAAGAAIYAASKHAVEGLTKSVALEVASSGIRVNAVAPGPTNTDMIVRFTGDAAGADSLGKSLPAQRLGEADEIAPAIVFAAIGKAHFLTGHSISVDGAFTA
ncbi:SDR family oxidoreductase [Bradyrhizobium sp. ARR65]|uniref:SDR family NAD(P)-dependent oxidoreductase n=1 Tax=Bradyrhizobium sp. ARR65 TaxID=1040989 RepID=UPI00046779FC|nr:SDR family oxidoreductase [Bradyrhizobium sp. ARR65]